MLAENVSTVSDTNHETSEQSWSTEGQLNTSSLRTLSSISSSSSPTAPASTGMVVITELRSLNEKLTKLADKMERVGNDIHFLAYFIRSGLVGCVAFICWKKFIRP